MAKARDIEGLDCRAGSAEGVLLTLVTRLDETLEHRDAALVAEDPEGVHDMRVASRRLRSAPRDFTPYLDEKKVSGVRGELKKLADALGRARDLDVERAALEEAAQGAPEGLRAGVEELARARGAGGAAAREDLADAFREDRLARLRAEFADALDRALGAGARRRGRGKGGAGGESFARVGREVVLARWDELRERAASLYRPFKTRRLHKTRISAKRLRYALELFAPCLGEGAKDLAKEVAGLQKSLGELHDCDELIASLGAELSKREGDAGRATRGGDGDGVGGHDRSEASAWLFDYFVERRNRNFRDAFARWRAWGSEDFDSRLRECVEAGAGARASSESAGPVGSAEPAEKV